MSASDDLKWKRLDSTPMLPTHVFTIYRENFTHPRLPRPVPFWVMDGIDWCNVIGIDTDSVRRSNARMLWVRQYRMGTDSVTLEIPGGCCDPHDAEPRQSAARELLEETGARAERWVYLGGPSPNAALNRNRIHTFLALGCRVDPTVKLGDGQEILEPLWLPFSKRYEPVLQGQVDHALILGALALLEARLQQNDRDL